MTIDTNELRRLAQEATPGPWMVYEVGVGFEIAAGDNVIAQAQSIPNDTINHTGRRANAAFIAAANPAAISELIDRLEAAEEERDAARKCADMLALALNTSNHELDALRVKIERTERQKPVEWQTRTRPAWNDGTWGQWRKCSEEYAQDIKKTPLLHDWLYEARALYALTAAKGEEK